MTESTDKSHCRPTRFPRKTNMFKRDSRKRTICFRRAIYFWYFFCGRCWNYFWVPGSMLSCFSAFLLLCFSCFSAFPASLLFLLVCFTCFFAFPASLLFCFCALPASFLFCFSAFPASLLFFFCASVPFHFYYSPFSFLQSCVFAALLPAPLLLYFLSLLPLCFFFSFALFSPVCKHPRWNPKKP